MNKYNAEYGKLEKSLASSAGRWGGHLILALTAYSSQGLRA